MLVLAASFVLAVRSFERTYASFPAVDPPFTYTSLFHTKAQAPLRQHHAPELDRFSQLLDCTSVLGAGAGAGNNSAATTEVAMVRLLLWKLWDRPVSRLSLAWFDIKTFLRAIFSGAWSLCGSVQL